jgi:hypothetical protein
MCEAQMRFNRVPLKGFPFLMSEVVGLIKAVAMPLSKTD